ncbi:hypothetical protein ACFO0N_01160 [Halobium salinum]|uniref:Uncharacterized protein n=1 Tax=Halobium salinum TaxID=1364940 RepID=A0ABD5P756_9EURY|nr:hypothetical protein [Halobium salinum]
MISTGNDRDHARLFERDHETAHEKLNNILGGDTLKAFREDLADIFQETSEVSNVSEDQKREWWRIGRRGLEDSRGQFRNLKRGLTVIEYLDSVITHGIAFVVGCLISTQLGQSWALGAAISMLLSFIFKRLYDGRILSQALVEQLAYKPEELSTRLEAPELRFKAGWNSGVLNSTTSLVGLVILGIVASPGSWSYRNGLQAVKVYAKIKHH